MGDVKSSVLLNADACLRGQGNEQLGPCREEGDQAGAVHVPHPVLLKLQHITKAVSESEE